MAQFAPQRTYLDLVPTLPVGATPDRRPDAVRRRREALRDAAVRWGLREVITPLFADPGLGGAFGDAGTVVVDNPLKAVTKALRVSLLPGLLSTVRSNLPRVDSADLFELGVVAQATVAGAPTEHNRLGVVLWRRRSHDRNEASARRDVADAVVTILRTAGLGMPEFAPARRRGFEAVGGAEVIIGGRIVGMTGTPDRSAVPDAPRFGRPAVAELDVDALTAPPVRPAAVRLPPPGRPIELDVTVVVPVGLPTHQVVSVLTAGFDGAAERITLIHEYQGPRIATDHRALTVRVWLTVGDSGARKADAFKLRDRAVGRVRDLVAGAPDERG